MPPAPDEFQLVLTTVDTAELAERLARELVERRLAACVNILGPIRSIYRWEGAVESAEERLVILKTRVAAFSCVRDALSELHPYDVPEILAIPVADGASAYLGWLADSTTEAP